MRASLARRFLHALRTSPQEGRPRGLQCSDRRLSASGRSRRSSKREAWTPRPPSGSGQHFGPQGRLRSTTWSRTENSLSRAGSRPSPATRREYTLAAGADRQVEAVTLVGQMDGNKLVLTTTEKGDADGDPLDRRSRGSARSGRWSSIREADTAFRSGFPESPKYGYTRADAHLCSRRGTVASSAS